jgi:hypothetical protein
MIGMAFAWQPAAASNLGRPRRAPHGNPLEM